MKIKDIKNILDASIICGEENLETEVLSACASDMMSDVLAYVKDQAVLITGLCNPQVVRTALMMDMHCILFVRGKKPDKFTIDLAKEKKIVILSSNHRMYIACGILYKNGLMGGEQDVK